MIEILEEDISGDLQFSTYMGDDMWLEHDINGDVQFALYQQDGGSCPPQPDVDFLTSPCEFKPNVIDLRNPNCLKPQNVRIEE